MTPATFRAATEGTKQMTANSTPTAIRTTGDDGSTLTEIVADRSAASEFAARVSALREDWFEHDVASIELIRGGQTIRAAHWKFKGTPDAYMSETGA